MSSIEEESYMGRPLRLKIRNLEIWNLEIDRLDKETNLSRKALPEFSIHFYSIRNKLAEKEELFPKLFYKSAIIYQLFIRWRRSSRRKNTKMKDGQLQPLASFEIFMCDKYKQEMPEELWEITLSATFTMACL